MGNGTATAAHPVGVGRDASGRKVTPRETRAFGTDTINITNDTDDVIKIQFAEDHLFKRDRLDLKPGEEIELELPDVKEKVECPYAIFCMDIEDFAHGSTMPIIIVEPKG